MLDISTGRQTAEVIAFPERRNSGGARPRAPETQSDIRSLQIAKGAFDGAWYHDAAILEALRGSKR